MLGMGKKKARAPPAPPAGGMGVPTQKVMSLSSQGMSEPEIVKTLREEGHSPLEVDRAMKDAMRSAAGTHQPAPAPPAPSAPSTPPRPVHPPAQAPAPPPQAAPPPPGPESTGPPGPQLGPPNRFAPTDWGEDDDMPDDDFDMEKAERLPAERKMGPGAFMGSMDEKLPALPDEEPEAPEPLPFAKAPLPKERDERVRELKDRRRKEIEELTEEITEEKWKDIMSRVRLLEENLEKMAGDIKNTSAQTRGGSPEDLGTIKEELANQKESVEEVNARIDSLEDIVKSSLGPMLESVRKFNKMSKTHTQHLRETPSATPRREEPPAEAEPSRDAEETGPSEAPRYSPQAEKK
jgi:archaellum component FlaC